jgi:hypothetical protein
MGVKRETDRLHYTANQEGVGFTYEWGGLSAYGKTASQCPLGGELTALQASRLSPVNGGISLVTL